MVVLPPQMASRASPDIFINDLDASIFLPLAQILDINAAWRKLISVFPEGYYSASDVHYFEQESLRRMGEPSSALLHDMGNKGVTVGKLIPYLEALQLERALVLIKDFEPVQVIRDLPPNITVRSGTSSHLRVECQASGFPRPSFQWFKFDDLEEDWADLIEQSGSALNIQYVRPKDAGIYCCRVTNCNPHSEDNEPIVVFSSNMSVKVIPPAVVLPHETKKGCKMPPTITRQPISPCNGKVVIGAPLSFNCDAESDYPITYEWYRNGIAVKGEERGELHLENLQPVNGENKFTIQCKVSNCYGSTLSKELTIPLAAPLQNCQCMAEDKVALLIGNQNYSNHVSLNSVIVDVKTLAELLTQMDFKVLTLINLEKHEMHNAVDEFCNLLDTNVYGFFYYAGHGFQQHGQCYMLPIDAKTEYSSNDCVCIEDVEARMQHHNPALCCLLIDMCRKEPQNDFKQNYVVYQPKVNRNRVRAYSTTYSCAALDGTNGTNGVFMKYLKQYISKKIPITEVLDNVVRVFYCDAQANKKQFPEISSNLGIPRSLTDKIMPSLQSYDDRQENYRRLTSHLPATIDAPIKINKRELKICIEFESWSQVVHNVLEVRLLVTDTYSNGPNAYRATIHDIKASENEEVRFSFLKQDESDDGAYLTYVIEDLQKIHGSITLIVNVFEQDTMLERHQVYVGLPLICQARLWRRPRHLEATEEEESGFGSLSLTPKSHNYGSPYSEYCLRQSYKDFAS